MNGNVIRCVLFSLQRAPQPCFVKCHFSSAHITASDALNAKHAAFYIDAEMQMYLKMRLRFQIADVPLNTKSLNGN